MPYSKQDIRMKRFEAYKDQVVPPECYIVVRLDGVGFSKFTKALGCEKPFDRQFMVTMQVVTEHLMKEVPDIEVGYVQSDEITLVFQRDTEWFSRRIEKIASVLAARASSYMSAKLTAMAINQGRYIAGYPAFDARLSVFPTQDHVSENLSWRIDDSVKNCRNLLVFWGMVHSGMSERQATKVMLNKGRDFYNEWMFQNLGINFNDYDARRKRGTLFFRAEIHKKGYNPHLKKDTVCVRSAVFSEPAPDTRRVAPLTYIADRRRALFAESAKTVDQEMGHGLR